MLSFGSAPSRFPEVVAAVLTAPDAFLDSYIADTLPRLPQVTPRTKDIVHRSCDAIRNSLAKHGGRLRRRHLEEAVFLSVSTEFPSLQFRGLYDLGRVRQVGARSPQVAKAICDILTAIATAYQARESLRWKAVGGLLKDHSPAVVAALQQPESTPPPEPRIAEIATWLEGMCDISKVPFQRLLTFRESGLFRTYKEEIVKVQVPSHGESFSLVNKDFMVFLTKDYLPAIANLVEDANGSNIIELARRAADQTVAHAGTAAGLTAGTAITPALNHFLQSWHVPGFGHVLKIGGITVTWMVANIITVPLGRRVESAVKWFRARRSAWHKAQRASGYKWL
jgi:hypothetical protein